MAKLNNRIKDISEYQTAVFSGEKVCYLPVTSEEKVKMEFIHFLQTNLSGQKVSLATGEGVFQILVNAYDIERKNAEAEAIRFLKSHQAYLNTCHNFWKMHYCKILADLNFQINNYEISQELYTQSLVLAQADGFFEMQIRLIYRLALINLKVHDYFAFKSKIASFESLYQDDNLSFGEYMLNHLKALDQFGKGDYAKAKSYLEETLHDWQVLRDRTVHFFIYLLRGKIYLRLHDFVGCQDCVKKLHVLMTSGYQTIVDFYLANIYVEKFYIVEAKNIVLAYREKIQYLDEQLKNEYLCLKLKISIYGNDNILDKEDMNYLSAKQITEDVDEDDINLWWKFYQFKYQRQDINDQLNELRRLYEHYGQLNNLFIVRVVMIAQWIIKNDPKRIINNMHDLVTFCSRYDFPRRSNIFFNLSKLLQKEIGENELACQHIIKLWPYNYLIKTRENDHVKLELKKGEIIVNGKRHIEIPHTGLIRKLLRVLATEDRGFPLQELTTKLWNEKYNPLYHNNRIYNAIKTLRDFLSKNKINQEIIINIPGGYRLISSCHHKKKTSLAKEDLILAQLNLLKEGSVIELEFLADKLGKSKRQIARDLYKLEQAKMVISRGKGRGKRYFKT